MSWLAATAVGLLAGVLASMGLGGGFVLLVYLMLFTDSAQTASQGLNLLFFLPVVAVSVAVHLKNRLIDVKKALLMGLFGAVAVPGGYFLARAMEQDLLRKAFAVFIIAAGLKDLLFTKKKAAADKGGEKASRP